MRRTTVFLDESLQRELSALARKQARPAAALVREAIGAYVVSQKAANPTALSFIAVGGSGRADTAERHEELLFGHLQPGGDAVPGPDPSGKPAIRPRTRKVNARRRRSRRG